MTRTELLVAVALTVLVVAKTIEAHAQHRVHDVFMYCSFESRCRSDRDCRPNEKCNRYECCERKTCGSCRRDDDCRYGEICSKVGCCERGVSRPVHCKRNDDDYCRRSSDCRYGDVCNRDVDCCGWAVEQIIFIPPYTPRGAGAGLVLAENFNSL